MRSGSEGCIVSRSCYSRWYLSLLAILSGHRLRVFHRGEAKGAPGSSSAEIVPGRRLVTTSSHDVDKSATAQPAKRKELTGSCS